MGTVCLQEVSVSGGSTVFLSYALACVASVSNYHKKVRARAKINKNEGGGLWLSALFLLTQEVKF